MALSSRISVKFGMILDALVASIRDCRFCETATPPLPHDARPILQASRKAPIRIISQAPGNLAHQSGIPFMDPSGVRLRDWLGVGEPEFYDPSLFSITPMGFCFPGYDKSGGDLPPRPECAALWHSQIHDALQGTELTLLVGAYAQRHYLGKDGKRTLTDTVKHWKIYGPDIIPLPHPSWRNNGWIKKHEWFGEVIDHLRQRVQNTLKTHNLDS